ncbi:MULTISPECIES: hypothetical protein [unclassified Bradyrhizobium]|uniref:hypothetical protein n=2 Tax=unclassified Bradyrhizobium TaxID=2631580 RepID=UPI0028E6E8B9|nr:MULTISPECIES: hypothetical protein [unclassified Bradyrhizobium]
MLAAPMARLQQRKQAAVTTGQPKQSGIPCAMVLRLYVVSPGTGSIAPVHVKQSFIALRQCAVSALRRPQHREARTARLHVRIDVVRRREQITLQPDTATATRLAHRDDRAYAPSHRGGMDIVIHDFWKNEIEKFRRRGEPCRLSLKSLVKRVFTRGRLSASSRGNALRNHAKSLK